MKLIVHPEGCKGVIDSVAGSFACALGRGGVTTAKKEGDGATPAGIWPLRRLLVRTDRIAPQDIVTGLPVVPIDRQDGWCDDPVHAAYNRPVRLPFAAGHEVMWRDDHLYDLVVVLGHNDAPSVPGCGSAIFMHLARPDYGPTEGCVALARADLLAVLATVAEGNVIDIRPES
ncbi:MAG: L,D-transpeptidase family protein [Rhodospirillales bacterium]